MDDEAEPAPKVDVEAEPEPETEVDEEADGEADEEGATKTADASGLDGTGAVV